MQPGIDFLRLRFPQVFEGETVSERKREESSSFTAREKDLMADFQRRKLPREHLRLEHGKLERSQFFRNFPY